MNSIVIGIATYRRPLMLKKLIISIMDCNIDNSIIERVSIIVEDNDKNRTAENTIAELKKEYIKYDLQYFNYPPKGISNIRNEIVKNALLQNPDFLIFIDDDEYTTVDWLNELVRTIISNQADAARGPVLAVLDKDIPRDIAYWFQRESYPNNQRLFSIKTGNLILRVNSLKKYDVWFDPRFNVIGSGDSYFGIQILKKGATIFWAAKAVAYETIPSDRATLEWLIKRNYRLSSTYSYVLKLEKKYLKLIKKIMVSVVYIIFGTIGLILILLPVQKKYWGILKLSQGIGGLLGGSFLYKEYK
jgi:succinoglycan biosynthesis protein ExoM